MLELSLTLIVKNHQLLQYRCWRSFRGRNLKQCKCFSSKVYWILHNKKWSTLRYSHSVIRWGVTFFQMSISLINETRRHRCKTRNSRFFSYLKVQFVPKRRSFPSVFTKFISVAWTLKVMTLRWLHYGLCCNFTENIVIRPFFYVTRCLLVLWFQIVVLSVGTSHMVKTNNSEISDTKTSQAHALLLLHICASQPF